MKTKQIVKYPYLLFGSAPIGPLALEALKRAYYPPTLYVDDPKLSLEEQLQLVEEYQPTFILVVGYGAILKQKLLDTVAGQVLNIHPSLLPDYRGPAPVVQAVLDGATDTGVTLIQIDSKMDHGPVIAQESITLRGTETPRDIYSILIQKGVELFLNEIEDYLNEESEMLPQSDDFATFTHFIKKEDGLLKWDDDPEYNERKIRAFQDWPRTWVMMDEKRLIIDKAYLEDGKLRLEIVQPEGKKAMSFKEFCTGLRMKEEEVYAKLEGN